MTLLAHHRPEYRSYLRSASWRRHRRAAFIFWFALWAGALAGLIVEHAPLIVLAGLGCLAVGKHDGHHVTYKHLGHERPYEVVPVSHRVNWFENVLHHHLKMRHVPATLLALATLGVWPVWVYLAVRAAVG